MKYRSRTHVLFAICAFLIAYVGYILFANFKTEIERKQLLSELFTTEARHIKNQTDFIMAVYRKMIEDLSSDRRIVAYFLNKRMGMSEAYGLHRHSKSVCLYPGYWCSFMPGPYNIQLATAYWPA